MKEANQSKIKWTNDALKSQLDNQNTDSEISRLQEEMMDKYRLQAALD